MSLRLAPVEGQGCLAEGEAVEMAGDGVLQRSELAGGARFEAALSQVASEWLDAATLQRRESGWLPRYALAGVTWELP